jgi:hypothetical protein
LDYVVNIELRAGGDLEEQADRLMTALERATEGMDADAVVAAAERTHMLMVAVSVDAGDGVDALDQARELFETIYADAFPDLAFPSILKITAAPEGTEGVAAPHTLEEADDLEPAT